MFFVKWRVENLKSWFQSRDDSLYSPQFIAEALANTRWKLKLSRNVHLAEKYITLALERDIEDDHPGTILLYCELSFLASNGYALKSQVFTTKFAPKTVSQELNLKEIEIFDDKKDYLPQGVLTISCKMWTDRCVSKVKRCLIQSVIGRKSITLDGTIERFSGVDSNKIVPAYFASASSEISFISFDVYRCPHQLRFDRKKLKCNDLYFYSLKLFFIDDNGEKRVLMNTNDLRSKLVSNESFSFDTSYCYYDLDDYVINDALALHLEVTYYPGVQSESIEYKDTNMIHAVVVAESEDSENVNISNCEIDFSSPSHSLHLPEYVKKQFDDEKNESTDEDECCDNAEKRNLPSTTLKEDLTSLYNDHLFCDTKLKTDTETFPAHRSVLSARSPVFKKMFTTDMKEKAGECINVTDISSDTLRRMLQFLYTDCAGDLEMQSAKDLYVASDKFDIASLKQRCSSFLKKNLCPANVCEIIVLADMHLDKDLLSAAHEFVLTYDQEVFGSDEWRLFMKNFSSLAAEVMYLKCMKK